MNPRLLVIGYGNELRGDDAVGPRAARSVAAWRLPGVEGIAAHQLTPELAERIGAAERVVFVDAGQDDVVQTQPIKPGRNAPLLAHTGEPRDLLALAGTLYGRRPEAWVITLPAPELGFGEKLSGSAKRGLAEALRQIRILAGTFTAAAEAGGGDRGVNCCVTITISTSDAPAPIPPSPHD
jgi:hydrogenase maturation protease